MTNITITYGDSKKLPVVLPKDALINRITSLYEKGMPDGYYTSIKSLDDICRLDKGRLVTITGVPNYGKSEFVDFLSVALNKRYGLKTLYYSPENQPIELHLEKLVRKYTNKHFDRDSTSKDELLDAIDYIGDNFFFLNYSRVNRLDDIIAIARKTIEEKAVDILVLDAYNKIESDMPNGEIETNFISKVLDRLCSLAIEMNIIVMLVAHPKKMEWDECKKAYKCPRAYDINGSANFYNKSDYVFTVHRDFNREDVIIKVDKVKFSNYGKPGECKLKYDKVSGNYYEIPDELAYYDEEECNMYKPIPFKMPVRPEAKDPLDVEVSFYAGTTDSVGTTVNLRDFLMSDQYKDIAEEIRAGATPEERHDIKSRLKSKIPAITIAGTFSHRSNGQLDKASGLIGIDIDLKDNPDSIDSVYDTVRQLPYVAYLGKSISGDGYFAICPISNPDDIRGHYLALEKDFRDLGIVIDKQCKDAARLRFASYDEDAYHNPYAETYCNVAEEEPRFETSTSRTPLPTFYTSTSLPEETLRKRIETMELSGGTVPDDYQSWYELGMSISSELGESGRPYFHRLSEASPKYNHEECDEQYDRCLSSSFNNYTLATAIKQLKEATIII